MTVLAHDHFHPHILEFQLVVNQSEQLHCASVRHMRAPHFDARLFCRQLWMRLRQFSIEKKCDVGIEAFLKLMQLLVGTVPL